MATFVWGLGLGSALTQVGAALYWHNGDFGASAVLTFALTLWIWAFMD